MEGKGKLVIMLPGPPKEMIPMFTDSAMPYLSRYSGKTIVSHTIHFFGIGESLLESRMHEYMLAHKNPSVAPYAKDGEVQVRVTASAPSHAEAEKMLQPVVAEICRELWKISLRRGHRHHAEGTGGGAAKEAPDHCCGRRRLRRQSGQAHHRGARQRPGL